MRNAGICPALLRELLDCNYKTGALTWRARPGEKAFNNKLSGKPAITSKNTNGYFQGTVLKENLLAHRIVWAHYYGEWPDYELDHINRIKTDNRIENLRKADRSINNKNRKLGKNNTSGCKGVEQRKSGRWRASIGHQGKRINLGTFETFDEAVAARRAAEIKYGYTSER